MDPRSVKTPDDAKKIIEHLNLDHIKVGVFDIDGILRGKYMSRDKFFSALDKGFGFCDVVLGWDSQDQLYDNVSYTGWHTGYPDASVQIIPNSCRAIPFESNTLFFLGEFDQQAKSICPRSVLQANKAKTMGYKIKAGFEFEFFVFDESRESIREKNYQNLKPLAPGYFGYSVLRNSVDTDIYHSILDLCTKMDFPLESLHEETGPGVIEAAIQVDGGLNAADKAALFKTFLKIIIQRQNKIATFMAKWSADWPGQSGHIHISLLDQDNNPVFYDASAKDSISETMSHFVAGQQKLMPEFLAMIAPTINSYTRLVPGFWAPTAASWGIDNRTCALRVIQANSKSAAASQRVEYRVAAADANPYLALAAAVASGLYGIENKLELKPGLQGNAYEHKHNKSAQLPSSLSDAAGLFGQSSAAKEYFGLAFVEHFSASRLWEEREFRKHISDWELDRYFEII